MCTPELKTPVYTKQARPAYCVLARMNEGAETVLFGDKFSDWKGALGIIKVAEPSSKKVIVSFLMNFNLWNFILPVTGCSCGVNAVRYQSNVTRKEGPPLYRRS